MKKLVILLLVISGVNCSNNFAQNPDMSIYNGGWESQIHPSSFSYKISVEVQSEREYIFSLHNYQQVFSEKIVSTFDDKIALSFLGICEFTGSFNDDKSEIHGFIKVRSYLFHLSLKKTANNTFQGEWNSFYVNELNPAKVYLAIENGKEDNFEAYPVFPDNRYRGTYATDFQKTGDEITFADNRSGHSFVGRLQEGRISMDVMLGTAKVTSLEFVPSNDDWDSGSKAISKHLNVLNPIEKNDGLAVGSIKTVTQDISHLQRMKDSIEIEALTNVHSLLIAQKGSLIYENYFNGFNADLPHDTRSAAKSIASAAIGIAIEDDILEGVDSKIYDYLPAEYQYTKTEQKEKIALHHLLTMSSGLDAIDFGIDRIGAATEDNYQQSDNWLKTVLEAPMIYDPGQYSNYGSANPYLLGVALAEKNEIPLATYLDEKLFNPLGIVNYSEPICDRGEVYFGGGSYFIPRDLLKFGLLYANKGNWKGRQLIAQEWVEASFKNYKVLENTSEKNGYGYLFWHETHEVNGRKIQSVEARGAGGQLIAIVNELDLVVVMNSGNYRNGRYWQPQLMMKEYILPCFVE